jgi:hypothetical protein
MAGTIREMQTGRQLELGPHYKLLLQLHERQGKWYHMLSVAKINAKDYEQLRRAFVENYSTKVSQQVVIVDFNDMKQGRDEPVQEFFAWIGNT